MIIIGIWGILAIFIVWLIVIWEKLNSTENGTIIATLIKMILIVLFFVGYVILAIRFI